MICDLKNYRAPRASPWPIILWFAVVFTLLTFIGPGDFADELAREADAKILRAELARCRQHNETRVDKARRVAVTCDQPASPGVPQRK